MAKVKKTSFFSRCISKLMVFFVVVLLVLIVLKGNADLRNLFYKNVFQDNFNFAKVNEVYKKYFGSSLPIVDNTSDTQMVSSEKIEYSSLSDYKDGAKLVVDEGYAVPLIESGIVIFVGEKDGYGNTVVVQQSDDVEVWYANLADTSVELYDYIKKGEIVGSVEDKTLYIAFVKEGKSLDYKKFI